jgi:hypothetical protein
VRCLWRYCQAEIQPVTQLVRPSSTATERVIPIHDVAGRGSWFGRCPASGILLRNGDRISQTAVDVLTAADGTYQRMHDERNARGQHRTEAAAAEEQLRHDATATFRPAPPEREDYFPERPGEPAGQNVPKHAVGVSQGGREMDDIRAQLKALTHLAQEGFEQATGLAAALATEIERLQNMIFELEVKAAESMALARAAVGNAGADLPESAENMVGSGSAALSTIEHMRATAATLLMQANAAAESLGAAGRSAEDYFRVP